MSFGFEDRQPHGDAHTAWNKRSTGLKILWGCLCFMEDKKKRAPVLYWCPLGYKNLVGTEIYLAAEPTGVQPAVACKQVTFDSAAAEGPRASSGQAIAWQPTYSSLQNPTFRVARS